MGSGHSKVDNCIRLPIQKLQDQSPHFYSLLNVPSRYDLVVRGTLNLSALDHSLTQFTHLPLHVPHMIKEALYEWVPWHKTILNS